MGEASNPGPSKERSPSDILCRLETVLTRLDSSDEVPLVRLASGRNVARRVSVMDHTIPPSLPDDLRDGGFGPSISVVARSFEQQVRRSGVSVQSRACVGFCGFRKKSLQVLTPSMKLCLARAPHCWMSWRMISPELTTSKFWAEGQRAR